MSKLGRSIKMDPWHRSIGHEGVIWTGLTQDAVQKYTFMNKVINLQVVGAYRSLAR
jgi:hypothetical protein